MGKLFSRGVFFPAKATLVVSILFAGNFLAFAADTTDSGFGAGSLGPTNDLPSLPGEAPSASSTTLNPNTPTTSNFGTGTFKTSETDSSTTLKPIELGSSSNQTTSTPTTSINGGEKFQTSDVNPPATLNSKNIGDSLKKQPTSSTAPGLGFKGFNPNPSATSSLQSGNVQSNGSTFQMGSKIPSATPSNANANSNSVTSKADPDKLNVPLFNGFISVSQFTKDGTLNGFATIVYNLIAIIIESLAVLMIVIGGVEIMSGGASSDSVDAGKKRIIGVLSGLALFYSIGLILHTALPFFFK